MPDPEDSQRRPPRLHNASIALLLTVLGCQTAGEARSARASDVAAMRKGGTHHGAGATLDGRSLRAPMPPRTTRASAPVAKSVALTPHLRACLSARPDLARAHVSLTVLRGSPEIRLVLQAMLKKKAETLGVDVAFDSERCGSHALICAWIHSRTAGELATSWAQSLIDPTPGELYAIRSDVLHSADDWEQTSFWWRVHTSSSALGRRVPATVDLQLLSQTRGSNYLRSAPVTQLEASLRQALIGAELSVFDPAPPGSLATTLQSLADRAHGPSPNHGPSPTANTPRSNTDDLVTLKEKDGPEPAVAVFAWGSDDETSTSLELQLGLEVLRSRFNQAHSKETGIRAGWSPQRPFSAPARLVLLGPASSMHRAVALLRHELAGLTSPSDLPTHAELDRALLHVRSQEQGSAPRSLCREIQNVLAPADVTRTLRALPEPHVVLATSQESPRTEAE